MPEPRRQLIIEEHMLCVCPHCWTPEQIAKEYPELAHYEVSRRLCNAHFQVLLTTALEYEIPIRKPDLQAGGEEAKSEKPKKATRR